MKRYVVLIAYEPSVWDDASPEQQDAWYGDHARFDAFVAEHGRLRSTAPLEGTDLATTVHHAGDELVVTEGPFAETHEVVAGYYDVELPDLDVAIAGCALLPRPFSVEIRPVEV